MLSSCVVIFVVLCLGTEDRATDKPVPAGTSTVPYVSFPGSEIKDLFVHEPTEAPAPPAAERKSQPPQPPRNDKPKYDKPRNDNRKGTDNRNAGRDSRQQNEQPKQPRQPREMSGYTPGMGDHLKNMRVRSEGGAEADGDKSAAAIKKQQDFDFQAALTNFDKVAISEEVKNEKAAVATEASVEPVAVKYVKDDFFDSLTNEKTMRPTFQAERSLNQDTFGASSVQSNRRTGGRGGGRGGRGGRGRGRGGRGSAAGRAYNAPV